MKIAIVNLYTPFASNDSAGFAAELTNRLRERGHTVEEIRLPLRPTLPQRLAARLIRIGTGDPDLVVIADIGAHTGDWDETIARILEGGQTDSFFRDSPPITDVESLALADTVSAILAELGSTDLDDLAETMARQIAELGPNGIASLSPNAGPFRAME